MLNAVYAAQKPSRAQLAQRASKLFVIHWQNWTVMFLLTMMLVDYYMPCASVVLAESWGRDLCLQRLRYRTEN